MDNKALLAKIEIWLQQASNHRYAAHFPTQTFFKKGTTKRIAGENGLFHILNNFGQISFFSQRLPQTNFFVAEYYTQQFLIKIIEFYDNACFLIYPLKEMDTDKLTLEIGCDRSVLTSSTIEQNSTTSYDISIIGSTLIWLSSEQEVTKLDKLYEYLTNALNSEYTLHPLSQVKSSNIDILREIDYCWNETSYIKDSREIDLSKLMTGRIEDLIWLQEIYLHFGWAQELTNFYNALRGYCTEAEAKIPSIVENCQGRFLHIGKQEKDESSSKQSSVDFLAQYLSGKIDLKAIQEFWNYIHLPLFSFYLENEIKKHPDKFIAFLLLGLKHNFIWVNQLFEILILHVNSQTGILLKLLFLLKKHSSLHVSDGQIEFQTNPGRDAVAESSAPSHELKVATIQSHGQKWTNLVINGSVELKINQPVILKYVPESEQIDFNPLLFHPLAELPEFQKCLIKIGEYQLTIPLCWNQFEITFNRVRIKFLRKKIRFQLSFRFNKSNDPVLVNSTHQIDSSSKYNKIFLPVARQASLISALPVNKFGATNNLVGNLSLMGWAADSFGILSDRVRIHKPGIQQWYNRNINSGEFSENNSVTASGKIEISSRGCNKLIIDFPDINFLDFLLMIPAEIFKNRVVFYGEKDNTLAISQMIYKSIGFYPLIRDIESISVQPQEYTIIVSPVFKSEIVGSKEKLKVICLHKKWKIKGLLIHPDGIKRVLDTHFQSK